MDSGICEYEEVGYIVLVVFFIIPSIFFSPSNLVEATTSVTNGPYVCL